MLDAEKLKKYIGEKNYNEIEPMLVQCDPAVVNNISLKDPKLTLILSILFGYIGIDRLYQGGIKMMLIKLATIILTFGTWYIADLYYAKFTVLEDNKAKILSTITA